MVRSGRLMLLFVALGIAPGTLACGSEEPWFESVLEPSDTYDPGGPYQLDVYVRAPRGVAGVVAQVAEAAGSSSFSEIALTQLEGDATSGRYGLELRGRPAPSTYELYYVLIDGAGVAVTYPAEAPAERLRFNILRGPP